MRTPIWNDPFPPMPASFDARLDRALAVAQTSEGRRVRKASLALVAVLALLIALSAAALAASRSGILSRWFGDQTPPAETERLLRQPGDSVTAQGVTLALDEYIADENQLTLMWSVASSREDAVAVVGGAPILDGLDTTACAGFAARWVAMEGMELLGGAGSRSVATASYKIGESARWPIQAVLEVAIHAPDAPDLSQPWASLRLPIALEKPETDSIKTHSDRVFEFDDYTLSIDRLEFSGASAVFEWTLTSKRPVSFASYSKLTGKTGETHPLMRREYVLLDGAGNSLTEGCESLGHFDGPEAKQLEDGRGRLHGVCEWSPLPQSPQSVVVMPLANDPERMQRMIESGCDHEAALRACYIPSEAVHVMGIEQENP